METLFLCHRIPFPPDRGDKIRSYHVLRRLARLGPVHLATFTDDDADGPAEAQLACITASQCVVKRTKPLWLAAGEALATRAPVSLTAFRHSAIADYVRDTLKHRRIGAIYVFSGQMAQYVPADYAGRVIVDFVDVDSAKFEAYGAAKRGPRGWIDRREARLLRREEARASRRAHASLLVSAQEAALFRDRLPVGADPIAVRAMANGIDSAAFDPALVAPEPALAAMGFPRIVFTGQMDYEPNIEACRRAAVAILPRIRARWPEASFHIVGRNPAEPLRALSGKGGVHVWGRVPDVRPWLAAADLALVPLRIGRGVQNKVLEAMAMALPVVLTPQAASGIAACDGQDFAVAEGDAELAEACLTLLAEPGQARAMGLAARRHVVRHASWEAALAPLPDIVGAGNADARSAA